MSLFVADCPCGWIAEAPTRQAAEWMQEAHWFGHAVGMGVR